MRSIVLAKIVLLAGTISGALFLPEQALADSSKAKATKVISVHLNSGGIATTITSEPPAKLASAPCDSRRMPKRITAWELR